jgi:hypothetical protein
MKEPWAVISMANHAAGGPIWEHIRRPAWVRLINAAGAALRRVGVRWPRLDAGTNAAGDRLGGPARSALTITATPTYAAHEEWYGGRSGVSWRDLQPVRRFLRASGTARA